MKVNRSGNAATRQMHMYKSTRGNVTVSHSQLTSKGLRVWSDNCLIDKMQEQTFTFALCGSRAVSTKRKAARRHIYMSIRSIINYVSIRHTPQCMILWRTCHRCHYGAERTHSDLSSTVSFLKSWLFERCLKLTPLRCKKAPEYQKQRWNTKNHTRAK